MTLPNQATEVVEADWHVELERGAGEARVLDPDLRAEFINYLRPRAERQRLERQSGTRRRSLRPPTITDVWIDRQVALRGTDVIVTWEGLEPPSAQVFVVGPDRSEQVVTGRNSVAVRAVTSGPITLRLRNQQGNEFRFSGDYQAGRIEVFELPAFRTRTEALPPVPTARLPRVIIPAHVSNAVRVPITRISVESVSRLRRKASRTAPQIVGVATQVTRQFRTLISTTRSMLSELRVGLSRNRDHTSRH